MAHHKILFTILSGGPSGYRTQVRNAFNPKGLQQFFTVAQYLMLAGPWGLALHQNLPLDSL